MIDPLIFASCVLLIAAFVYVVCLNRLGIFKIPKTWIKGHYVNDFWDRCYEIDKFHPNRCDFLTKYNKIKRYNPFYSNNTLSSEKRERKFNDKISEMVKYEKMKISEME